MPSRLRPAADLRILDITKFFGPTTGGIRTYLLEKARYLSAQPGLAQTILVPGAEDGWDDGDGVRWYRVRGPRIPTQAPYRALLRRQVIARLITHEQPSLVEAGSPYLVPWMARQATERLRIPLVWFFHTNFPRIIAPRPGRTAWFRTWIGRGADRYVATLRRCCFAALAASRAGARELERAGFDRVYQVSLGVDLDHFHPRRLARRESTRRRHALPDGPLVMFAGRLAREKELGLVLDAWPEVEQQTGAALALVGDGPSRRHFQKRNRARRVFWVPYQTDRDALADLLAAADLVVAPGPAETFGLAALEALASGVPVVASDAGAVRELVEASGAGAVNPEPRSDVMAKTLVSLLGKDLSALGMQGRRYAEAEHGWNRVFERIVAVYRDLLREYYRS